MTKSPLVLILRLIVLKDNGSFPDQSQRQVKQKWNNPWLLRLSMTNFCMYCDNVVVFFSYQASLAANSLYWETKKWIMTQVSVCTWTQSCPTPSTHPHTLVVVWLWTTQWLWRDLRISCWVLLWDLRGKSLRNREKDLFRKPGELFLSTNDSWTYRSLVLKTSLIFMVM